MIVGDATQRSAFGRTGLRFAGAILLMLAVGGEASAIPSTLSGAIEVNASDGAIDGAQLSALNQRYSLNWSKRLLPYLTGRVSLSYDRLGTETGNSADVWREHFQPVMELGWDHPLFVASATLLRRDSESQDDRTEIVRRSLGLSFRTRPIRYPVLSLRYDTDHTYNSRNRQDRDTQERRYQVSLNYNVERQSFYYNFTRRDSDLRSANAEVSESWHLFRWDQTADLFDPRLRLTTGYNFSHRRQTDRIEGAAATLRAIAVAAALYAEDASPDFGSLDSLRTLADGNVTAPVLPRIDIGQNSKVWNIGVDFGFTRPAHGLNVYTDRPSGTAVSWDLFHSSDNLTWHRVTTGVDDAFNTSFNRYEITFPVIEARYLKVVLGGVNEFLNVGVTEIEALEETRDGEDTRTQTAHQVNAALRAEISEAVQAGVDLQYRTEPSSDFSGSSDQFFYGASARHAPSRVFSHTLNYQAGWEEYQTSDGKLSSVSLSYAMTVAPLQTLKFMLSGVSRYNTSGGVREQNNRSAQLRISGEVLRDLDISVDVGYSRADQLFSDRRFDSWTYQTSVDAGLTRSLDAVVTYLYQTNRQLTDDDLRIRRQITANLTLQLSRSILLRGGLIQNDDDGREYLSQEYSGVWRLSRRTSVSALTNLKENTGDVLSRRHSLMMNHKLSSPTSLTLSYSETSSKGSNDRTYNSFQIGIRSGF